MNARSEEHFGIASEKRRLQLYVKTRRALCFGQTAWSFGKDIKSELTL